MHRPRRENHRSPRPPVWAAASAWFGVALIALLNLLAVSPEAHAWLHGETASSACYAHAHAHAHDQEQAHAALPTHSVAFAAAIPSASCAAPLADHGSHDADEHDDGCIVTQFSQGHLGACFTPPLQIAARLDVLAVVVTTSPTSVHSTARLLPPGRGPPVA